jgi:Spy/CpxP family protein refolding chaperone
MNNIVKGKFWGIVIVLLLLANLGTLIAFWVKREKHAEHREAMQGRGGPYEFLTKELALDSTQKLTFQKLRDEHQQGSREMKESIRDAKDALFALLQQPNVDQNALQQALKAIGDKEMALDSFTFQHFRKVREVCNEEQKKKFDVVIKQALATGARGDGSPPQGRQGQPPPDGMRPPPPDGEGRPEGPPPPPAN